MNLPRLSDFGKSPAAPKRPVAAKSAGLSTKPATAKKFFKKKK